MAIVLDFNIKCCTKSIAANKNWSVSYRLF